MSEKSHVGMGFCLCPVCGKKHDEVVLLDTKLEWVPGKGNQLRQSLAPDNFMGWSLCPEDEAKTAEYIALVEVSNMPANGATMKQEEAERTGTLVHMRRTVAKQMFNIELPDTLPLVFVEPGVVQKIVQIMQEQGVPVEGAAP